MGRFIIACIFVLLVIASSLTGAFLARDALDALSNSVDEIESAANDGDYQLARLKTDKLEQLLESKKSLLYTFVRRDLVNTVIMSSSALKSYCLEENSADLHSEIGRLRAALRTTRDAALSLL